MHLFSELDTANRCLRDLVALSMIPAIWAGGDPEQIAEGLAEALHSSIGSDLVYLALKDPETAAVREFVRANSETVSTEERRKIGASIEAWLESASDDIPLVIDLVAGKMSLAVHPLGPANEFGLVAVGARRTEFPTRVDRLLLNVAANQALLALRTTQRMADQQKVTERTARLEEIIRELESFSYSVSHDLRTPLRAMEGYAQALLEDCGDRVGPVGKDYIDRISRSVVRMDKLVQDVLAYSRVTRCHLTKEPLHLEELLHDVLQHDPAIYETAAQVSLLPPLLPVLGHDALLTQCFSNILGNAAKFVAPGVTPRICIRTEPIGDRVRIWFEDNGIGLRPEQQARVFGMFERLHPDLKIEGTGIGLAIVRKAAERMGGSVGVVSAPGQGSQFWIELPAAGVPAERGVYAASPWKGSRRSETGGGSGSK